MNNAAKPALTETQQKAFAAMADDAEYVREHTSKAPATPSQRTIDLLASLTRHDVPDWML